MSGSSRSSTSSTTSNRTTAVNSTLRDNAIQVVGNKNKITATDHGAIKEAFGFAKATSDNSYTFAKESSDDAFDFARQSQQEVLGNASKMVSGQVAAIKELATQLKVGDIESGKWIAFAVIAAAVVLVLAFMFLRGKK